MKSSLSLLSIALISALSTLTACGGSSDSGDTLVTNLAPTLTLQVPDSALSMQALSLTATAVDPEKDPVTLNWKLQPGDGVAIEQQGATFDFVVPLTKEDDQYNLEVTATDSKGNSTRASKSFTVPAITVDFSLPFDAVSQRYIDIQANITNLAESAKYQWQFAGEISYPLTGSNTTKARFYAEAPLTKSYDPNDNQGPNYVRGVGITQDVDLKFTVTNNEQHLDFNHNIQIKPFEDVTLWPEHTVAATIAKQLLSNHENDPNSSDSCMMKTETLKLHYDFTKDEVDDVLCTDDEKLYFYTSNKNGSDQPTYDETLIDGIEVCSQDSDEAKLIDLNNDSTPELVISTLVSLEGFSNKYCMALSSASYNANTHTFDSANITTLDKTISSYRLLKNNNQLLFAYYNPPTGAYDAPLAQIIAFNLSVPQPVIETSLELKVESSYDTLVSFEQNDVDEIGTAELILLTKNTNYPIVKHDGLFVIQDDLIDYSHYNAINIHRENIDDDSFLEWVGYDFWTHPAGFDLDPKLETKVHLTLDANQKLLATVIESYAKDIYFPFKSRDTVSDINSDGRSDKLTQYGWYHLNDEPQAHDIYVTYTLADTARQVLVSSMENKKGEFNSRAYPVGILDMDNDGDLDIQIGSIAADGKITVTSWLENKQGYPLN